MTVVVTVTYKEDVDVLRSKQKTLTMKGNSIRCFSTGAAMFTLLSHFYITNQA